MRITLIHNSSAGSAGDAQSVIALLREAGHEVRFQARKEKGWKRALDEPADAIAVVGGDGTIGKVAKRIAGRGIPIAPLPGGTANNISRSLGLIGRHDEELVHGWAKARRVKVDLAQLSGAGKPRQVIEGIGAGLFALAGERVDRHPTVQSIPHADAKVSYVQQLLKEYLAHLEPTPIKASLDGEDVSGDYLLFEAMILPFIGPNLHLAPDAKPGDGQFDLVMVGAAERARLIHYLEAWRDDKPRLAVLPSRRGRRLDLHWSGFKMHIDDKAWPPEDERPEPGPLRLEMSGEAVEFLVPDPKKRR